MELGPCRINDNNGTHFHPESWTEKANIFFVDQPIGVGFSYANHGERVVRTLNFWFPMLVCYSHSPLRGFKRADRVQRKMLQRTWQPLLSYFLRTSLNSKGEHSTWQENPMGCVPIIMTRCCSIKFCSGPIHSTLCIGGL